MVQIEHKIKKKLNTKLRKKFWPYIWVNVVKYRQILFHSRFTS